MNVNRGANTFAGLCCAFTLALQLCAPAAAGADGGEHPPIAWVRCLAPRLIKHREAAFAVPVGDSCLTDWGTDEDRWAFHQDF